MIQKWVQEFLQEIPLSLILSQIFAFQKRIFSSVRTQGYDIHFVGAFVGSDLPLFFAVVPVIPD